MYKKFWAFWKKKKDLYNFNISGVFESEKCGYFTAQKLLFQNTLSK